MDLYGSALGSVTFSGGKITRENAPTIDDTHSFVRAYVIDSETGDKEEIESAELRNGRVFFKLINENEEMLERSYTQGDAASKIYFEYLSMAETIKVTFEPDTAEGQDIILTSSSGTNVAYAPKTANGVAEEHFTVSVPRNATPVINTEGVTFEEDVSTAQRTVYRYKINTSQDLNIPIRSEVKETLTITAKASNDGKHADDWNMAAACLPGKVNDNGHYETSCIRKDYFYSNTEIVTDRVQDSEIAKNNYNKTSILEDTKDITYGDTVHYKVYHDMTYYGGNVPRVSSSYMSILWINGQAFGAPQPTARFGVSAYPDEVGNPYDRPYSEDDELNYDQRAGYKYRDKLFSVFSRKQGWEPWQSWDKMKYWESINEPNGFYRWYNDVVKTHVIGQKTQTYVTHGPLAGATVTITITDAKPDNYVGKLNTFDEVKASETDRKTGWDDTTAYNKGAHNSLRIAYDVEIKNAPTDLTATPEWVQTSNAKIGMYLNYGVENVTVFNGGVNSKPDDKILSDYKSPVDDHKADKGWFNTANAANAFEDPNFGGSAVEDPRLPLKGDVKNGYTNPTYRDLAISEIHGVVNEVPVGLATNGEDNGWSSGSGWYSNRPVFVRIENPIENNAKNGFVYTGGMNVIGIEASLVNIPVDYDYDAANGGTVQNPQNFPDKATSLADASGRFLYDVEGNPFIHVPLETPTKENAKFVGWHAYTMLNDSVVTDLGMVKPGESLNISDEAQMGSRINDISGNIIFNNVRIVAEYIGSERQATDSFIVNHVYKENEDSEQEDGSETVASFVSIHGSDSSLTESGEKKFAPDKLEYNGNKYKLVLSDDASPRGGYTTFTDTSTSMTFTYVRTRGTVKVRYEDTEGNLLPDTKEITLVDNGLEGTEYESTKEEFTDYVFVDMKEDSAPAKGTVQEGDQTVVYVYRPKIKVPNTGLDVPMGPTLAILLDAVLATGIFLLIRRKRRGL
ncbi:MAG: MucBP domain-containing protein [Faecalicoccus sp.]|uniref:MucBP domain-containing protein n=1 Tax=Faecalicoccus sp. TaxID=1971758 RepID=UPI002A82AD0D|nr:MucBP domain-containing protein [Faecalicoccus sp.]MDY4278326.1 MucBP domain-containing protein [Faecalicoccus sp.]